MLIFKIIYKIIYLYFFSVYKSEKLILSKAKRKERLWKEAQKKYQNVSEEEKKEEERSEKDIKIFLKKKKKKSINIFADVPEIFLRNKSKSWLSIEEIFINY